MDGQRFRISGARLWRWALSADSTAVRRPAGLLAGAMIWGLAVFAWPRFPAAVDAAGLGRQSDVLTTAAGIAGGLVVLALTVGSVAVQVLSQFSWRLNSIIVDRRLLAVISVAVVGGVVLPLWVAAAPSPAATRWAFASFGWSVLLIVLAGWVAAERIRPAWLVDRACVAALRLVELSALSRPGVQEKLASSGASLAELVGSGGLPYEDFRKAVMSYVAVLAARSRTGTGIADVASAVRDLAAQAQEHMSGARAESLILALAGLGIAQADCPEIHTATWEALRGIAAHLRKAGEGAAAHLALDGMVDVVDARIERLLPVARIPELEAPAGDEDRGSNSGLGYVATVVARPTGDGEPVLWWPTVSVRQEGFGTAFPAIRSVAGQPLAVLVARFARGEQVEPHEIASSLHMAHLVRDHDDAGDDAEGIRRRTDSSVAYELHGVVAAELMSLLPSPFPDSNGWPGGWQGPGDLDRDVRRMTGVIAAVYLRGQYPPSSAVEVALEEVAGMLRREPARLADVPADRTGWRDPPTAEEEGGPASAAAAGLGALAQLAFDAGFDRRALLSARRVLAAATSSARAGDAHGLVANAHAVRVFGRDAILHGRHGRNRAGARREQVLLAGLITETDQLLAHHGDSRLREPVQMISDSLVWSAHRTPAFTLAAMLWQAELAAAGWPVLIPGALTSFGWEKERTDPIPLPSLLLTKAEETISLELSRQDPIWVSGTLIALWAHAIAATKAGGPGEAKRIAGFIREQLQKHGALHRMVPYRRPPDGQDTAPGVRSVHPQVRRLAKAVTAWCESGDLTVRCVIPAAPGARTVSKAAQALLATPGCADWTYTGLQTADDESLVIVKEPDGSRRLLRDSEARARAQFGWGYGGNGPHALAATLARDVLDNQIHCPRCLGGSPCGAGIVTCPNCSDSGQRPGTRLAMGLLVEKVISELPTANKWQLTRRGILEHIDSQH